MSNRLDLMRHLASLPLPYPRRGELGYRCHAKCLLKNVWVALGNPIILTMGEAALIAKAHQSIILSFTIVNYFYLENSCQDFKKQHRNMK